MKIRLFRIVAAVALATGSLGLAACAGYQCDDDFTGSTSATLADDCDGDDDDD